MRLISAQKFFLGFDFSEALVLLGTFCLPLSFMASSWSWKLCINLGYPLIQTCTSHLRLKRENKYSAFGGGQENENI